MTSSLGCNVDAVSDAHISWKCTHEFSHSDFSTVVLFNFQALNVDTFDSTQVHSVASIAPSETGRTAVGAEQVRNELLSELIA